MDHSNVNLEPEVEDAEIEVESTISGLPTSEDVRSIGEIIRDTRNLSAEQVEKVLEYQRSHGVKFGEAAIALGVATPDDVLRALAKQFNYAYGGADRQRLSPDLVVLNQPFGQQAEAIRATRAQVMMRLQRESETGVKIKRAIAVVSPNMGDGKTFLTANLAVALAQLGGRTLVVDADLRGPRMHEVFKVPNTVGLSGLLSARRGEQVINPVNGVPNLFVLPVGASPPNPLELVEGPAFGMVLREVLTRFDHVIVDTPAAVHGADSAVIAARCGTALVVARRDVNRLDDLHSMVEVLNAANARIAGIVMNEF
jgi:chain length determinant protein tyrosine kinase EpsG